MPGHLVIWRKANTRDYRRKPGFAVILPQAPAGGAGVQPRCCVGPESRCDIGQCGGIVATVCLRRGGLSRAKAVGDGVAPVDQQVGHRFGYKWRQTEADLEPAVGNELAGVVRMGPEDGLT